MAVTTMRVAISVDAGSARVILEALTACARFLPQMTADEALTFNAAVAVCEHRITVEPTS